MKLKKVKSETKILESFQLMSLSLYQLELSDLSGKERLKENVKHFGPKNHNTPFAIAFPPTFFLPGTRDDSVQSFRSDHRMQVSRRPFNSSSATIRFVSITTNSVRRDRGPFVEVRQARMQSVAQSSTGFNIFV